MGSQRVSADLVGDSVTSSTENLEGLELEEETETVVVMVVTGIKRTLFTAGVLSSTGSVTRKGRVLC